MEDIYYTIRAMLYLHDIPTELHSKIVYPAMKGNPIASAVNQYWGLMEKEFNVFTRFEMEDVPIVIQQGDTYISGTQLWRVPVEDTDYPNQYFPN